MSAKTRELPCDRRHYRGSDKIGWVLVDSMRGPCAMNDVWLFLRDESGATAIEYALIAGGIALVIIAAVNTVGSTLTGIFEEVEAELAVSRIGLCAKKPQQDHACCGFCRISANLCGSCRMKEMPPQFDANTPSVSLLRSVKSSPLNSLSSVYRCREGRRGHWVKLQVGASNEQVHVAFSERRVGCDGH